MVQATNTTAGKMPCAEPRSDSPLGTGPFHAALRAAIRQRGLTLDRLRCHLARRGVSVALSALSDWQHGHRRPGGANSLQVLRALEEVLGLPGESLVRLLVAPGSAGQPEGGALRLLRPSRGLDERGGAISDLLDSLPGSRDRGVEIVNRQDKVRVDADRRAWLITSRTVVRARRDGVDRYVVRYFGDEGCDIDQVQVRPRENCWLRQVRRHRDPPVLLAGKTVGCDRCAGTATRRCSSPNCSSAPCCEPAKHGYSRTG